MVSRSKYIIEKLYEIPWEDSLPLVDKKLQSFMSDGKKIILCILKGENVYFSVWDVINGKCISTKQLKLKNNQFALRNNMIVSPNGRFIGLVGGSSYIGTNFVYIWNIDPDDFDEFKLVYSYIPRDEENFRSHLKWSQEENNSFPSAFLNHIKIRYDFIDMDHLSVSPSGSFFLIQKRLQFGEDYICLYNYDGYYEIRRNRFPNRMFGSLEIASDDKHALTAGQGLMGDYGDTLTPTDSIYYWNLKTMEPERIFPSKDMYIRCASFFKNGEIIISGGIYGGITAWDVKTGESIAHQQTEDGFLSIQGSLTGDVFYSIDDYGQLALWNLKLDQ